MSGLVDNRKTAHVIELLEQMEELFTELRLEYLKITRSFDDAVERIEELESDRIYYEDLLEEYVGKGGAA